MSTESGNTRVGAMLDRVDASLLSSRWGRIALRTLSVIGFLITWWALVTFDVTIVGFEFGLFVGPLETLGALVTHLSGKPVTSGGMPLYVHALYSTWRVAAGVGIATLLAIPLGLLVGTSRRWEDFVYPAMEALRPIPPVAWVPISVLIFPTLSVTALTINTSVLFVVFIGAFFPIFVNTVEGAKSVEDEYPRAAKSLGADRSAVFRHVILPATLPSILTGISLGIGLGWITVVAAEIVAGNYGLGYVIYHAYRVLETQMVAVGMVSIGVLGYASSAFAKGLGRRLTPWGTVETNR
jgi:NitT/TauT family transport system permease protein